ncbi:MAG: transposase, partial [Pirellulales bacterium]|nr:transposase [Pirellulales bacterium]
MSVQDIAKLGKMLAQFLAIFACCFARPGGRTLSAVYVRGLLSGVRRKNAEAIALDQFVAPRTLQRFLESIVWDEQKLRDRCQQLLATEHARPEAIGCIDETGTAGVQRQHNGNRGKIENCVNRVTLAYSVPGFDRAEHLFKLGECIGNQPEASAREKAHIPSRTLRVCESSLSRTTLPGGSRPPDLPCPPKRAGFQRPSQNTQQTTRRTGNRYRTKNRCRTNQIGTAENAAMLRSIHRTWRCPG